MRVPNISIYDNAKYNLGGLTSDLQKANEVIATQKRINSISDDPIGISQVLNLKASIGNLDQIEKNVHMGISWLTGGENALDGVNNLILDAKTQVSRLVNASMSSNERRDAIGSINGIIDQIITLGNTQINGNYIFSGLDTNTPPLEHHDEDPPRVSYNGNNSLFEIKTDKQVTVAVGRDGLETFWDDTVDINTTNNTIIFKEDNGHGSASELILETTIDPGTYNTAQLENAIRNALNNTSDNDGYGVAYEVEYDKEDASFSIQEDGSYDGFMRTEFMWETGADAYITQISVTSSMNPDDVNVTVVNSDALTLDTPQPHGSEPFRLTWQGNDTWAIDNNPGYIIIPSTITGSHDTIGIDLNESGTADITITLDNPVTARGQSIAFEIVSAQGDHSVGNEIGFNADNSIYVPPTSDNSAVFVTELVIAGTNDTIDFSEDGGGTILSATIPNITYTDMDVLALAIKTSMETASDAGGGFIDYAVSYDAQESRFNIRQDGSSLDELQILWSNSSAASLTAATLGYQPLDDIITYPSSDNMVLAPITVDNTNNVIDFEEISIDGTVSDEISITIPTGVYTVLDDVATAMQTALREASPNNIDYVVAYDNPPGQFMIKGSGEDIKGFSLLWQTGDSRDQSAGDLLGFSGDDTVTFSESDQAIVNITINAGNDKIDFKEILKGNEGLDVDDLTAVIKQKTYTSHSQLALEVEKALEEASYQDGNRINYSVTWDNYTQNFTIKENGTDLAQFDLLWETGTNAPISAGGTGESIGSILGFDTTDDVAAAVESDRDVEWGIFNTLIDLNAYLTDNDTYGIERTLGRLEEHYSKMTSRIVDSGIKYKRLEIREQLTISNGLSLTERRSNLEDADMIEAIMNLQSFETAYQASLSSSAKIMNLSLVDYL